MQCTNCFTVCDVDIIEELYIIGIRVCDVDQMEEFHLVDVTVGDAD
jgi:hypothetical protein